MKKRCIAILLAVLMLLPSTVAYAGTELQILQQPEDIMAPIDTTGFAVVQAEAEGEITYLWYYKYVDSDEWIAAGSEVEDTDDEDAELVLVDTSMEGWNTDTIFVPVTEDSIGRQFKCVLTDENGNTIETEPVTVTLKEDEASELEILTQPANIEAALGETGTATVEAAADTDVAVSYRWFIYDAELDIWELSELEGWNTDTISVPVTEENLGRQLKCLIRTADGASIETEEIIVLEAAPVEPEPDPDLTEEPTDPEPTDPEAPVEPKAPEQPAEIVIEAQPADIKAAIGETGTATVLASSDAALSYQWFYKTRTGTEWKASGFVGCDTDTIYVPVTEARIGQQYKCVITNEDGVCVETEVVTVMLPKAAEIIIVTQPTDIKARLGETGTATVEATSDAELSYQWFFKRGNGAWTPSGFEGCTTDTIVVPVAAERLGQQYKCLIRNADGVSVETDVITVREQDPAEIIIVTQPTDIKARLGETGTATVEAISDAELSYQWYFKRGNGAWTPSGFEGCTTDTIAVPVAAERIGQQYKCLIRNADGVSVETDVITVREPDPSVITIVTPPVDIQGKEGAIGTARVEAVADTGEALSYQWFYKAINSNTWKASGFDGCQTAAISVPVETKRVGQQYKCVITTADGGKAETEAVTVLKPLPTEITIVTQPADIVERLGVTGSATVEAVGDTAAALNYQWYFKVKNGSVWEASGFAGCQTATIQVPVEAVRLGQQYKCVITTADGGRVETIAVTVGVPAPTEITIEIQPTDLYGVLGDYATATVAVSADTDAPLSYQWYFKRGSGAWKESGFEGCHTDTIVVPVEAERLGQLYKCVITTPDGGRVETEPVKVCEKWSMPLDVIYNPLCYRAYAGTTVELEVAVNQSNDDVHYQWYKNGELLPGATERILFLTSVTAEDAGEYYCVATGGGYTVTCRTATVNVY